MILYWVVSKEAINLIHSDTVNLEIPFNYCECINEGYSSDNTSSAYQAQCDGANLGWNGNMTFSANAMCEAAYPLTIFVVLGSVLLAFFVQYDFTAAFKVWCLEKGWWNKIWAAIVLSESVYALYAGSLFAVQGV